MSRQNIVILLLFVASLAIWRWFDSSASDDADARHAIFQPNYTTRDLVTRRYDASGHLKEELHAGKTMIAVHTLVLRPRITVE